MKKNGILMSMLLMFIYLVVSCTANKENIKIKIELPNTDKIMGSYLYISKPVKYHKLDSVLIEKNKDILFEIKKQPIEELYQLTNEKKMIENVTFFAGTHDVQISLISLENEETPKPIFTTLVNSKGKEQLLYEQYSKELQLLLDKEKDLTVKWRDLVKAKNHLVPKLRAPFDSLAKLYRVQKQKYYEDYVSNHTNGTALYLLNSSLRFAFDDDKLDSILRVYPETYKETLLYKELDEKVRIMKNLEIGTIAPDFSIPDVDGAVISLSSFRGKYVLVDFWASWCGPCRAENPFLVEAYKQYKNAGFEIFGISYDSSRDRDKWLKAIKDDELTWPQVSNLKGWDDPTTKLYNISGIPSPFLLDPEGRIIAKNYEIRGEKLLEKLSEIFDNKKTAN